MGGAGVPQVLIRLVLWCSDHMLQLEVALCSEHVDNVFQVEIAFRAEIALMMKLSFGSEISAHAGIGERAWASLVAISLLWHLFDLVCAGISNGQF